MIDHVGLRVRDYPRARAFYEAALRPLGYKLMMELTPEMKLGYVGCGFGDVGPAFWIGAGDSSTGPAHVAFRARTRAQVKAFYEAALAAGGKDNGAPGLRPHYSPDYYGAFVLDPEGNNVEAVVREG
jgi:catechol 2,3-dioxygenase-like lactoylglutathione lyase family enzyme